MKYFVPLLFSYEVPLGMFGRQLLTSYLIKGSLMYRAKLGTRQVWWAFQIPMNEAIKLYY